MKQRLPFYGKISVLVLGCLLFSGVCKAQLGYWSTLGGHTPFPSNIESLVNAGGYNTSTMMFYNGSLYVPYLDDGCWIAVWNGSTWQNYKVPDSLDQQNLLEGFLLRSITHDNSGNIYLAGNHQDNAGIVIIKWDGTTFTKVGNSLPMHSWVGGPLGIYGYNIITTLCKDSAGNIYAGGTTLTGGYYEYIVKWDGANWSFLDSSSTTVLNVVPGYEYQFFMGEGMGTYGNTVYAKATTGIVRWNGSTWVNIDAPNSHVPQCFIIGPGGSIYASFGNQVSIWNGSTWTQLGNYNLLGANIQYLSLDSFGNVYVINHGFNSQGCEYVAKWDGHNWSELGTNNFALHANFVISSLAVSSTGDSVFAVGNFTSGQPYPTGNPYVAVYKTIPPGTLFAYLNSTDAGCGNNGTVTSTMYQGTPPYTYIWSNGATTANLDSLASGQYYVTVTDAHGLIATGDIAVRAGTCQSIISGTLFVDTAGTCIYTGQQPVIPNVILTLSGNNQTLYATTDSSGNYSFAVADTGNYHLYIQVSNNTFCGNFTLCGNANQVIHVGVLGDSVNRNNFALNPGTSSFDLYLHPGWTSADPGFEKDYWIYFANSSPVPFSGPVTLAFKYDSNLTFLSSDIPYTTYNAPADSITWVVNNFSDQGWNYIGKVRFNVPITLPLNTQLQSQFWIYPKAGDCDSTNNYLHYYETVIGAHDPNYKEVSPPGNITGADSLLTYTIHYQNTGSDSTHFIKVTDMLSRYLDPATVNNLASSVPYSSFSVSGTGLLTWVFVPYTLPDSSTDAQGSNGFISFSVKKKTSAPAGVNIANSATVYFDYAPAVLTNSVVDSVVYPPCAGTLYDTISASVCTGSTFFVGNHGHNHTGTFVDTLISLNSGCDSIVTLYLVVNPLSFDTLIQSICNGDTFYIANYAYTQTGTYTDTLTNINGCDSIVTLNLTVTNRDTINIFSGLCSGDSVYFYGRYVDSVGIYDTLLSGGCDTLVILTLLTQDPPGPTYIYDTICANSPVLFNGVYVDTAGFYYAHYSTGTSCDSMVILQLTVNPVPVVTLSWDSLIADHDFILGYQYPNSTYAIWCSPPFAFPMTFPMKGGNPIGGSYTGFLIYNNVFQGDSLSGFSVAWDTITYTYTDLNGCNSSVTDSVRIDICEGINTINPNNLFTLYPNPADDYVMIDFDATYTGSTIFIKDITGRQLLQTKLSTSPQQLPTGNLPPGVYLVTLYNNGQVGARLLVKE